VRSAASETERLARLTEDLLLVARADQDALPLVRTPTPVVEMFEAVAARFEARAAEAGRSLAVGTTDAVVDVDAARIEQALANLVDNALTYGDGTIELYASTADATLELHVADAGAGFPDDFVPRAFDRFSRADAARSDGGSGLGLSIVELVAKAHGGRAGVGRTAEGGADVWVAVPYVGDRLPAAALT
jgi:signal transduction histidine kinase